MQLPLGYNTEYTFGTANFVEAVVLVHLMHHKVGMVHVCLPLVFYMKCGLTVYIAISLI